MHTNPFFKGSNCCYPVLPRYCPLHLFFLYVKHKKNQALHESVTSCTHNKLYVKNHPTAYITRVQLHCAPKCTSHNKTNVAL